MRIARALLLSPLVPVLGIGVLGIAMGYRSAFDLAQFVLAWAIFLYPLVVSLVLAALLLNRRLGPCALWHFALGGLVVGSVLVFGYFSYPPDSNVPILARAMFGTIAGAIGAATAASAWYLAVRERAA